MMPTHRQLAADLVRETHALGGLAPVDLDRFWEAQEQALRDPFGRAAPQVPLGLAGMSVECVFDELGVPEDWWRLETDAAWRHGLCRRYNDRAEAAVGRRLLPEDPPPPPSPPPATGAPPPLAWPGAKSLADLFEAKNEWHDRSWWLMPSAQTEDGLAALLDRVDRRLERPRDFFLPPEWDERREALAAAGVRPPYYGWQRGPVTFAMSVYGAENLMLLIHDHEALAGRFRDAILRGMLALGDALLAEHGDPKPRGFGFADDNCALLSPDQYGFFAFPILEAVFGRYAPAAAGARPYRYQHSDSAMGHLLPYFSRLGMTGVNFGPALPVAEIRRHCPEAVIDGQLAPFTFCRHEEENMVAEFLRDAWQARDRRGLRFATAGSINNGSRLAGLRLLMAAAQRFGWDIPRDGAA